MQYLQDSPIKELSNALRRDINSAKEKGRLGRTVILTGAGCSVSAKIPLAKEIAQNLTCDLAISYGLTDDGDKNPEKYLRQLIKFGHISSDAIYNITKKAKVEINWSLVYDDLFTKHYNSPKEVHRIFSEIFEKSGKAEKRLIGRTYALVSLCALVIYLQF